MIQGKISGVNGPVIYVKDQMDFMVGEMVYVGNEKLVGEVISVTTEFTTVEVYEDTTGLKAGDIVYGTGSAMAVTLGPGIISNIFDGIERPLGEIGKKTGKYIGRGVSVTSLDEEKLWDTTMMISVNDVVKAGQIIATVPEGRAVVHKVMIPPDISGKVVSVVENLSLIHI